MVRKPFVFLHRCEPFVDMSAAFSTKDLLAGKRN